ncbi:MAG: PQQ-binding-like beta-propeller repeat protein [Micromonosporaceae bacterium]
MTARPALLLSVVLLAVTGCTGGAGADSSATRVPVPASTVRPTSDVEPLRFDKKPLWDRTTSHTGGEDSALDEINDFELLGDQLLYVGEKPDSHAARIVVADVATGKVRWSLTSGESLGSGAGTADLGASISAPTVAWVGGAWVVLVGYHKRNGAAMEEGVAALWGARGSVRWKIPVLADNRRGGDTRNNDWYSTYIGSTDGRTLLVDVTTFKPDDGTTSSTVAYDLTTQKKLWEAPGIDPWTVQGDTVYGEKPKPGSRDVPDDRGEEDAVVVALDAKTGKRKWDLGKRYPTSHMRRATDELLVVAVEDGAVFLDPDSGRKLAHLGKEIEWCGDQTGFVVCSVGEDHAPDLVTARRTGAKVTVTQLLDTGGGDLRRVWKDWLVVARFNREFTCTLLDRSGRRVGTKLPGCIGAIDEHHVVLYRGRTDIGSDVEFAVHRLAG